MKFKLDENLPGEGVQILRAAGHDAVTVLDQRLGGKPDPEIFAVAPSASPGSALAAPSPAPSLP